MFLRTAGGGLSAAVLAGSLLAGSAASAAGAATALVPDSIHIPVVEGDLRFGG